MHLSVETRRRVYVAAGFAGFVAISLGISYLFHGGPDRASAEQACVRKCADRHLSGTLVYSGPDTPKDAYKTINSVCECR